MIATNGNRTSQALVEVTPVIAMRLLGIRPHEARGYLVEALLPEEQEKLALFERNERNVRGTSYDIERKSKTQFKMNRRLARFYGLVEGS